MRDILDNLRAHTRARGSDLCLAEGTVRLPFQDVSDQTDALAARILEQAEPQTCIGWIGAAGADRLLAHIAIQKAGMVFCGPSSILEDHQISEILKLADCRLIIHQDGFEERAARFHIPTMAGAGSYPSLAQPFSRVSESDDWFAYRSYSSGSTGIPKVVSRARSALAAFTKITIDLQGITQEDRAGLVGNLWEPTMYSALSVGAQTYCFDAGRHSPVALAEWLNENKITSVMTYPALFRGLMAVRAPLPKLRSITLVGEPLTREDAEAHARWCSPDSELINAYGMTEYPYLTAQRRRARDPIDFDIMPLGKAIEPDTYRLVDEAGNDVRDGNVGEIQVTSSRLAGHYLGSPELSAQRFGTSADGVRTFLSGDLAYRDYQGVLHSMGRRDHQTKVRGFNVRPTEIEMVIKRHADVSEAVVTTQTDTNGIKRLVCHYTGEAQAERLKSFLSQSMPSYMVPTLWFRLDAFPKTHTGKIRRTDLPQPSGDKGELAVSSFVGSNEQKLATIFRDTLQLSDFARDDDFFDLGGDSLMAMRLALEIEREFGLRLPVSELVHQGASVASLATRLERKDTDAFTVLQPGTGGQTIALAYNLRGDLNGFLEFVHHLPKDFRVVGAYSPWIYRGSTRKSYRALAEEYVEQLAPELESGAPVILLGFSFGGPLALEAARVISKRGYVAPRLILVDPTLRWRGMRDIAAQMKHRLRMRNFSGAKELFVQMIEFAGLFERRTIRAIHARLFNRYIPSPYSGGRALYVSAANPNGRNQVENWKSVLPADTAFHFIDAEHLGIMRGEEAGPLAQEVQRWIHEG